MKTYICDNCGKSFDRFPSLVKGKNHFCCRECRYNWQKENLSGENNPNYKDGHTYKKSFCKCGNEKDWRAETCNECYIRNNFKGEKHTEETIKIISKKSSEKFTAEFKIKYRKTMEDRGYWLPISKINDYKYYYRLCEWDFIDKKEIENYNLIEEFKKFNPSSNPYGIVRDHIFSRRDGLYYLIFPEILKHPANCRYISNRDNSIKRSNSNISIDELFYRISNYNGSYKLHNVCLLLIEKYKNGCRYSREEYQKGVMPYEQVV